MYKDEINHKYFFLDSHVHFSMELPNYEIKTKRYTFSLVSDTDVEKSCFPCRVKISHQQFLTFLSFMNIVRSSFSQMLFKIGALKHFAIF